MKISNYFIANMQSGSLINNGVNKVLNDSVTEIISRTKCDTLTLSEQGLLESKLRNLDKTESSQTNDDQFLQLVSNLATAILTNLKSNIEDTMDQYSSSSAAEDTTVIASEDEIGCSEKPSFEQLQDRISELIKNAAKSLSELFKNTKSTSKELTGQIEEIKGMVDEFFNEESGLEQYNDEADYMAAIERTLENIDETITKVTKYSENQ